MTRQHAPSTYNTLKTAVKRLVLDVGGVDAAASCTRGTRSLFSDYGNITSDRHLPADAILDLETIGGVPHVTEALASAQGYRLVRVDPRPRDEVAAALARIGQSMGVLFSNAAAALADGVLTPVEAAGLSRDLESTGRVVSEALSLLRRELGAPAERTAGAASVVVEPRRRRP